MNQPKTIVSNDGPMYHLYSPSDSQVFRVIYFEGMGTLVLAGESGIALN